MNQAGRAGSLPRTALELLLILLLGTLTEFIGFSLAEYTGAVLARWFFWCLAGAFLILKFNLGFALRMPTWSMATLALTGLFSVLPFALQPLMHRFGIPLPNWEKTIWFYAIVSLWCPIFEEISFRQGLQQYWKMTGLRVSASIFLTSLVFAVYHMGFLFILLGPGRLELSKDFSEFLALQSAFAFFGGVLFSALRETGGSTLLCIVVHAAFNFLFFAQLAGAPDSR